jgi:hypothetical protein
VTALARVRSCLLAVVVLLTALPIQGEAQPAAKATRIGYLSPSSLAEDAVQTEAFRQGLRALRVDAIYPDLTTHGPTSSS